jgi:hypothetical protein
MSAVARYYDKEKNAEGASLAGVPLRDLTEEDFEALPAHLQRSVDAQRAARPSQRARPLRRPLLTRRLKASGSQ